MTPKRNKESLIQARKNRRGSVILHLRFSAVGVNGKSRDRNPGFATPFISFVRMLLHSAPMMSAISSVSVSVTVPMTRINHHRRRRRIIRAWRRTIHARCRAVRGFLHHDDAWRRPPDYNVWQWRQRNSNPHIHTRLRGDRSSEQGRRENQEFLHTREMTKHSAGSFNPASIFPR